MKCGSVQSSKRRSAWIRFHRTWITTTLVLIAIISPAATPDSPFDRAAWQQDYSELKDALQRSYANLAWFGSVQGMLDLPALDRLTSRSLAQAENDAQAEQILLSFVASFRDGHFSRLPSVEPAPSKLVAPKQTLLDPSDASAACAALGYSSDSRVSFSLPFESLAGFKLESDGLAHAFRAGVLTIASGQRIGILRIPSFHATQYASECEAVWRARANPKQPWDKEAIKKDIEQHWYATLAQQLKVFRATNVSAVLVDIGQNSGGDDSGDIAARLFSKNTVRSARLLMTQAAGTQAYLDEQIHALQQATENHASQDASAALSEARAKIDIMRTQLATEPCDLSWVFPWCYLYQDGC